VRGQENNAADDRKPYRHKGDRPAAYLIGEPAKQEERGEVAHDIDRINQRERDLREAELLLVDDVEWRDDRTAREQRADHGGHSADRGGVAEFDFRMRSIETGIVA
jgi:hypothetical protein